MNQEEKVRRQQQRYEKQYAREKKREKRRQKNVAGLVGFIIGIAAAGLSFTGWFVALAIVGLVFSWIGAGRKRPLERNKYMALFGLALGVFAIANAVRVSNQWEYDDPLPEVLFETQIESIAEVEE